MVWEMILSFLTLFLGKCCNLIFIRTDIHHIALIVEAVSYTHLDVYKRQLYLTRLSLNIVVIDRWHREL